MKHAKALVAAIIAVSVAMIFWLSDTAPYKQGGSHAPAMLESARIDDATQSSALQSGSYEDSKEKSRQRLSSDSSGNNDDGDTGDESLYETIQTLKLPILDACIALDISMSSAEIMENAEVYRDIAVLLDDSRSMSSEMQKRYLAEASRVEREALRLEMFEPPSPAYRGDSGFSVIDSKRVYYTQDDFPALFRFKKAIRALPGLVKAKIETSLPSAQGGR